MLNTMTLDDFIRDTVYNHYSDYDYMTREDAEYNIESWAFIDRIVILVSADEFAARHNNLVARELKKGVLMCLK